MAGIEPFGWQRSFATLIPRMGVVGVPGVGKKTALALAAAHVAKLVTGSRGVLAAGTLEEGQALAQACSAVFASHATEYAEGVWHFGRPDSQCSTVRVLSLSASRPVARPIFYDRGQVVFLGISEVDSFTPFEIRQLTSPASNLILRVTRDPACDPIAALLRANTEIRTVTIDENPHWGARR